MNIENIDMINKIVWFIPFRKMRDKTRNKIIDLLLKNEKECENHILNTLSRAVEMLTEVDDIAIKRNILKNNLSLIEIEIASYCNRKCWFCPNSIIDRHSNSIELPEELYLKILDDLSLIDYSGYLSFHRFNEPLANRELILKRVKQARKFLPNASLQIFTNGDYLTIDYLNELKESGINFILMSYYLSENEKYDIENVIKSAIDKMACKLGLDFDVVQNNQDGYKVKFIYEGLDIYYRSINFDNIGSDRGGVIEKLSNKEVVRDYECFYPITDLYIDYNGMVMPCCNMRSDVEYHKEYILGDISKNSIFEIFMSKKMIDMRKYLISKLPKDGPCKYCYYKGYDRILNWFNN